MKYFSLLIPLLLTSVNLLKADTVNLKNGETVQGQLIKVSNSDLIIEVLVDSNRIGTISLDRKKVLSAKDESGRTLYSHGIQQVGDLEDYYQKVYIPVFFKTSDKDTIIFKNGDQIIGDIIYIKGPYVIYKRSDRPSHHNFSTIVKGIESINGKNVQSHAKFTDPFESPPIKKVFNYPHPAIEFGLTFIQHNLNEYKTIYEQLAENPEKSYPRNFEDLNNPLIAINLGFDIKISRAFCLAFTGNFTLNFEDDEDFYEGKEKFRLFTSELRYTLPFKFFSPWIGVGYANQSLTIINRINNVDIKLNSQSNTILFATGITFNSSSWSGGIISLRYLPFGEQNVNLPDNVNLLSTPKINLSNIMLSTSLFIDL